MSRKQSESDPAFIIIPCNERSHHILYNYDCQIVGKINKESVYLHKIVKIANIYCLLR